MSAVKNEGEILIENLGYILVLCVSISGIV